MPNEDYDFVLEYISSRVPEAARENRGRSWPKRLSLSCLASLVVNGIAFAVNYFSFQKDQSLPLAVTMDAGGAVEQRAFGMRVYSFLRASTGEELVDFYYDAGLAFVGFIFVALAFFLLFSVGHWARKKMQG